MPQAFIPKNMLYGNFYENLRKNFLIRFGNYLFTNQGKNEDEDEKSWKNKFHL